MPGELEEKGCTDATWCWGKKKQILPKKHSQEGSEERRLKPKRRFARQGWGLFVSQVDGEK